MRYLFELSKEHKSIPKSEALACLCAEKANYEIIEENDDVLVVDTCKDKIKDIFNRLSYTFFVDEFLFSCSTSINKIKKYAIENSVDSKGSIAIKYKKRSDTVDSRPIIEALAEIYTKNRIVSLEKPDIEIRALITDSNVYVGVKKAEINRSIFEERKVQHRPFFSPISLHPKLARALVNLSVVKKGETLLDPFCGTGGILLEAGLIGAKVVGSDIEDKMIEGCKKTLDFYNIKNFSLFCLDIGDISKHVSEVDAVATDLPYGKSTTTKGEEMEDLYKRAFENISLVMKKDARAVIGLSNKNMISIGENYLSFVEKHDFRAHSSLTRYFVIFQK